MYHEQIVEPKYTEVVRYGFRPEHLVKRVCNLIDLWCNALEAADVQAGSEMARYLKASIRSSNLEKFWSRIMCTIKTHKPKVSLRILHSGTGHPFTALGHAIGAHLDSYLNGFSHLHRCTKTVLDQIKQKVFPQNICFCKLDIDDFYMSGTAGDLSLYSSLDMPASRELKELIFQMLVSQRVELPIEYQDKAESYTVNIGSGMGLHASGAISEKVFLELVEKPFACRNQVQQEYGILLYARYRDDILIIADRDKNNQWWKFGREIIKRAAPVYKVSLDEIKSSQIEYLDVCIYKPADFAIRKKLETKLYRKPTAQKILLHPSSCHVESVHRSWPGAEILRIGSLSSSYA
eukprot:10686507-Karenia_brevis.AAC.1